MSKEKKPFDIREYKRSLRDKYKKIRLSIPPEKKLEKDTKILKFVTGTPEYKACKTVLCYVSLKDETDTHKLIETAIRDGKTVGVPYCVEGTRDMLFYEITSLEQLEPRTFGVLEPDPAVSKQIEDFSCSICILPGLSFDMAGFRLGYGGGYYDRFLLQKYNGATVGICYDECTQTALRRGKYDAACSILITDLFLKRIDKNPVKPEATR